MPVLKYNNPQKRCKVGDNMKVHERIKAYIVDQGIALDALSKSSGIPQDQLGCMLSGKEILYAKDLKAICLALNVSPEIFIDTQGEDAND